MIDGEIRRTGDSRLIKSNPSLPATYPEFRELFISSGIPIDLLLNSAGWKILGTLLAKANLLTDETAAALGGVETVNEALGAIKSLTDDLSDSIIATDSDVGNLSVALASTNSALSSLTAAVGALNVQFKAFMTAGTFNFTAPKTGYYIVEVVGGGEQRFPGWRVSSADSGGGYARKLVYLTKAQSVTVTVGAPATGSSETYSTGYPSSFGSFVTAPGGGPNGFGGIPTSGDINIPGGSATASSSTSPALYLSGGSALSSPGAAPSGPGAGGNSYPAPNAAAQYAKPGCCIVTWME